MSELHKTPMAGHLGRDKIVQRVREHWTWPTLLSDVVEFVQQCDRCQRNKKEKGQAARAWQQVEARYPWEVVTMDFLCGLQPAAQMGHSAMLVMCDRFSRQVIARGCDDHLRAEDTVDMVMEFVVLEYGLPRLFITDRGPQFESTLWLGLWDALATRAALAATHHPETDGLLERNNRTILEMIRKYCQGEADKWERHFPYFSVRNQFRAACPHRGNPLSGLPRVAAPCTVVFRVHRRRPPTNPVASGRDDRAAERPSKESMGLCTAE